MREDYLLKMKEDKYFKQEMMAIEKLIQHEERMVQRKADLDFRQH